MLLARDGADGSDRPLPRPRDAAGVSQSPETSPPSLPPKAGEDALGWSLTSKPSYAPPPAMLADEMTMVCASALPPFAFSGGGGGGAPGPTAESSTPRGGADRGGVCAPGGVSHSAVSSRPDPRPCAPGNATVKRRRGPSAERPWRGAWIEARRGGAATGRRRKSAFSREIGKGERSNEDDAMQHPFVPRRYVLMQTRRSCARIRPAAPPAPASPRREGCRRRRGQRAPHPPGGTGRDRAIYFSLVDISGPSFPPVSEARRGAPRPPGAPLALPRCAPATVRPAWSGRGPSARRRRRPGRPFSGN